MLASVGEEGRNSLAFASKEIFTAGALSVCRGRSPEMDCIEKRQINSLTC
jgi:hypothetical protein